MYKNSGARKVHLKEKGFFETDDEKFSINLEF